MKNDGWVDLDILDPARLERAEEIAKTLYDSYYPQADIRDIYKKVLIDTFNPYRLPNGAWFDPSWIVKPDGNLELLEVSLMPGYLLDEEEE